MAHTKVTKTGTQNTGTANTFSYSGSFDVFKASEVEVELDNVKLTFTTSTINDSASPREYTVDYSAKTIHIGGGNLAGTNTVVIQPVTDMGAPTPRATYSPGSSVTSADLNNNQLQLMRKAMEYDEQKLSSRGGTMTGNLHFAKDIDITFEGDTDNAYETTLTVADPTSDKTITLPDTTGTVVTTGDTGTVTATMLAANSVDSSELVDGSIDSSHISTDAVITDKIAADAVTGAKIADNAINSEHYTDGSIDHIHLANDIIDGDNIQDNAINSEHYVDGSIDRVHLEADIIDSTKLADNAVNSEHITAGSVDLAHMSANSVDSDQYVDGSIDLIHMSANSVDSDQYVDGSIDLIHMSANSVDSDQYVDGSIDHVHLSNDCVDGDNIQDDSINSEHYVADSIDTEHYAPTSIDAAALASNAVIESKITDSNVTTDKIANNAITIGKIGCEQTTISDSDSHIPTSGAVVDYVAAQIAPIGGLEVIADEDNFPTSQPASGVVISISDAAGIVVNGSGVSTTARTAGNGSDNVTINNFPSSLYGETLASGVGLMVSSTGSSQTYNYHKILAAETDVKQLSDDINDFNARYRVAGSAPSSSLDEGDLWWDSATDKLKVYDGSSWEEVASSGDFYINTISSYSGTGGNSATFNGSAYRFVLSNPGSYAQQHIVSINGVIQKPNSGTSQPSEGFVIDGSSIIFSNAPATGSDYFILTLGTTVSIGTPSDGTVTAAKIASGAVTTVKIADANVTTAKIADDAVTGAKLSNHLDLPDNNTIRFGASNDLQIYHESATPQNIINSYTSNPLTIMSNGDTSIKSNNGDNMGVFKKDGAVELYYDDSKKLETTSTGATVTGNITAAKLLSSQSSGSAGLSFGDGVQINLGSGDDVRVYHNGADLYIDNDTGGTWVGLDSGATFGVGTGPAASPQALKAVIGAQVELMHNGTKMFETAAGGVTVTDDDTSVQVKLVSSSGTTGYLYGSGTNNIGLLDSGGDWAIKHENDDSTKFYVQTNLKATIDADGLKFGSDTATANALNDYEEGTWTPVVSNGVTSLSYAVQTGHYTKVGKFIHCSWYIRFDATGVSSTHFYMGGLPYTSANTSTYNSGGTIDYIDASFTNNADQKIYIGNNSSLIYFYNNNGGTSSPSASYLSTSSDTHHIYGHVTYRTG